MIRRLLCLFLFSMSILSADEVPLDWTHISLDTYLQQHSYYLSPLNSVKNEGYITHSQSQEFLKDLQQSPHIKTIAEIGLNAGHSCDLFLNSSDQREVTSFDINTHSYTSVAVDFFQNKYPTRFEFIPGDSAVTLKSYPQTSNRKFDLIFIDGCHSLEHAISDILDCRQLAHANTEIWIDDYYFAPVRQAVLTCRGNGIIKITAICHVKDESGLRAWAKAKYINLN